MAKEKGRKYAIGTWKNLYGRGSEPPNDRSVNKRGEAIYIPKKEGG